MSKGCSRWEFFFTAITLNPLFATSLRNSDY